MGVMSQVSANSFVFPSVLGAEALIELIDWHGKKAIRKTRIRKAYRDEKLDNRLRFKRTREETEILYHAKLLGVDCPVFYFADPQRFEIIMEFVEGTLLRDLVESTPYSKEKIGEIRSLSEITRVLGKYAAKLHTGDLIHGDLTTKNVILTKEHRLVLIDFGLSFVSSRIEDKAEDLHLLKQAFRSTVNPMQADNLFEKVMEGYASVSGEETCRRLRTQIREIEKRGRYARVD
jgi:Kae1-associated kinase Bud32